VGAEGVLEESFGEPPSLCLSFKKKLEIIRIKFVGAEGVLEESFGEPPSLCLSFKKNLR